MACIVVRGNRQPSWATPGGSRGARVVHSSCDGTCGARREWLFDATSRAPGVWLESVKYGNRSHHVFSHTSRLNPSTHSPSQPQEPRTIPVAMKFQLALAALFATSVLAQSSATDSAAAVSTMSPRATVPLSPNLFFSHTPLTASRLIWPRAPPRELRPAARPRPRATSPNRRLLSPRPRRPPTPAPLPARQPPQSSPLLLESRLLPWAPLPARPRPQPVAHLPLPRQARRPRRAAPARVAPSRRVLLPSWLLSPPWSKRATSRRGRVSHTCSTAQPYLFDICSPARTPSFSLRFTFSLFIPSTPLAYDDGLVVR